MAKKPTTEEKRRQAEIAEVEAQLSAAQRLLRVKMARESLISFTGMTMPDPEDPEAVERIASIKTERGRAISLGMYAALLAEKEPPPRRAVSRAPAPIRPVNGAARTELLPQQMTSEQLVEYYSREAMARRGL